MDFSPWPSCLYTVVAPPRFFQLFSFYNYDKIRKLRFFKQEPSFKLFDNILVR